MYGIAGTRDKAEIRRLVAQVKVPEFKAREGVRIATTDAEAEEMGMDGGTRERRGEGEILGIYCGGYL